MKRKTNSLTLNAPAKINLFLEVIGKRDDGYHDIESVMISVDALSDKVTIERSDTPGIIFSCKADCSVPGDIENVPEKENLAYKAAESFFSALKGKIKKIPFGVKIDIIKKIPVRAGIGGGSADAGAVLRGMNSIAGNPFNKAELCRIGAELGADVPFCTAGGAAFCFGTGEKMIPFDIPSPLHGIITVEKAEKASTADAYSKIDLLKERTIRRSDAVIKFLSAGDIKNAAAEFYNIFEKACDYSHEASDILKSHGALTAVLSGAGPSVISVFEKEEDMRAAEETLLSLGYPAYIF